MARACRARAVPGSASLHVGGKSSQEFPSPVLMKKRHRRPLIRVRRNKGRKRSGAPDAPSGAELTGSFPWPRPHKAPGAEASQRAVKTVVCSFGAKFFVPGVLPIVYASQEILIISISFLPVQTEARRD